MASRPVSPACLLPYPLVVFRLGPWLPYPLAVFRLGPWPEPNHMRRVSDPVLAPTVGYKGRTMQMLREAPSYDYDAWLDMHATEDAPIAGVYALFEREQCVFVGTGMDAVAALREVRSELGDNVTVKIEEHPPDQKGVLSLVYGSWLDEASPDGVRPRINAERAAERVARERGYYGT